MKILKGQVQWDNRNDIPCTYGEMDDGKQYYFIKELQNGNIIVTTSLIEAVDSDAKAKAKNIGLIDRDGNEIIPCVNNYIDYIDEKISQDIILVSPAEPVSENVKKSNILRADPLSATKLVSTPSQIKEKINSKMSSEGRYIFNDQFSEATICDINGNNLVNGEYYSFIALDDDKLFMAKNYPETDVVEFSLSSKSIVMNESEDENVIADESSEVVVSDENADVQQVDNNDENSEENVVSEAASSDENINEGFAMEDIDLGQNVNIDEVYNANYVTDGSVGQDIAPAPLSGMFDSAEDAPVNNDIAPASGIFDSAEDVPVNNDIAPASGMFDSAEDAPVNNDIAPASGMFDSAEVTPVNNDIAPASGIFDSAEDVPVNNDIAPASGMFDSVEATPIVQDTAPAPVSSLFREPVNVSNEEVAMTVGQTKIENDSNIFDGFNIGNETFDEITEETPTAEVNSDDINAEVENKDISDEVVDRESELERRLNELNEKFDSMNSYLARMENEENKVEEEPIAIENDDVLEKDDIEEDEDLNKDIFADSEIKIDSIDNFDSDNDFEDDFENESEEKDTTIVKMEDATKAISELMQKYTDKDNQLSEALVREEKLKSSRRIIAEKAKAQSEKIELLNSKIHDLVDANAKYESKIDSLTTSLDLQKRRAEEQKRTINEQERKIARLSSQLEGQDDLTRVLRDAKALIDDDNSEDEYHYRRAA